jgi:hypothetical protein
MWIYCHGVFAMKDMRVRMYRQGLGDCFLLTFPNRQGEAHVLIDCGVLTGTADALGRMRRVAQNIVETTKGRLDALVVTHEHWDHVSGFLQAEEIFNGMKVQEVWLAWTENPHDDLAKELDKRKARALRATVTAARQLNGVSNLGARHTAQRLNALLEFYGGLGVEGRKTTAKAMAWVKGREQAKLRYFEPEGEPFGVPGVEGVRVYVLGPPRDQRMLRKSDPSKRSSEVYELAGEGGADIGFFAAMEAMERGEEAAEQPFEAWFRVSETDSKSWQFFAERYWHEEEDWRTIDHDWLDVAGRLALQLDSDTNNTSLVLAFELCNSGRVLLFPGDAQVGSWLSWEGLEWKVKEGRETRTVTARDLMARTVLYKVGHHGSHNATLREKGLEAMSSDELAAMIPVSRETATKMQWKMPFPSLFRALEEKTRGRIMDRDRGVDSNKPGKLSEREWSRFVTRTDVQDGWVDYRVEL